MRVEHVSMSIVCIGHYSDFKAILMMKMLMLMRFYSFENVQLNSIEEMLAAIVGYIRPNSRQISYQIRAMIPWVLVQVAVIVNLCQYIAKICLLQ